MKRRSRRGTMYEFAPAFVVFVCFVLLPLVDISAIPVRYLIAQGVLSNVAQKLALAESRSEATAIANATGWRNVLGSCGVDVHPHPLTLVVCGKNETDKVSLAPSDMVPPAYLPNGNKGPCVYSMELAVDADIPPLYHGSSGLPGFTSPLTLKLACRSNWENMGRDPATRQYYINE
jgi:hypothetical protein